MQTLRFVSTAAAERRALAAQFDAEGKTGGFRPLLDLGHRMDAVFEQWLREQVDAG